MIKTEVDNMFLLPDYQDTLNTKGAALVKNRLEWYFWLSTISLSFVLVFANGTEKLTT